MQQAGQTAPPPLEGAVTPIRAALRGCCPKCAKSSIFSGLLGLKPCCEHCGLDLSSEDAGDGPAFFVITIMGALIVFLPAIVEFVFGWPLWLHLAVWVPFLFVGGWWLLRFFKSLLIALQYRHHRLEQEKNV